MNLKDLEVDLEKDMGQDMEMDQRLEMEMDMNMDMNMDMEMGLDIHLEMDMDMEMDQDLDMGFKSGNKDGNHYWLTPQDLYEKFDSEFKFDFDPCPYPKPDNFCGLDCDWGKSNWVNPPFGSIMKNGKKKGPTAWVRKAISEHQKGKDVVFVYPTDKWIHYLLQVGAEFRSLGDVKWCAIEDNMPGKGIGRYTMAFILKASR